MSHSSQAPHSHSPPERLRAERLRGSLLYAQLCWFIRLRWVFGSAALVAALGDRLGLGLFPNVSALIVLVGGVILVYNALLWTAVRSIGRMAPQQKGRRQRLLLLAWVQILLDLTALTLLVLLTNGLNSPLIGFYVFHMVFASLLLPRQLSFGAALAAVVLLCAGLWLKEGLPGGSSERLVLLGWSLTLLLTVYLANHITMGLRRHRRQLVRQSRRLAHTSRQLSRQNRRIRGMASQLRRHQQTMVQHEKMVALGQMAAGVTHEIANPLASMDSVLQLMQRRPDRLKPESVATLRQQVERITQIIQQMKAFAHPAEAQRQTLPLNEVVGNALDMIRFDKRIQRVQIERQYAADAGMVSMLPQALQQVLVNLIINAVDAMSATPEPRLIVRTVHEEGWRVVEVQDNGQGIAPEHMDRLFEPFFTTKPVGQGTGLGLSISYSLVQRMGGSIMARSAPGSGSTFSVRLPVDQPSPQRVDEPVSPGIGK
jgi:signal transduction histidine kinase